MILQYLQLVLIFAGAVVIGISLVISIGKQTRKHRLYHAAEKLLESPFERRRERFKTEGIRLSPQLSPRDVRIFLSMVQVSDISEDVFLKEVVNQLTGESFLPEPEPVERPLNF